MKKLLLLVLLASTASLVGAQTMNLHDFSARDIEGGNIDFSDYYGKKVMVVNTASFCAFTPQFEDLQNLYEQYNQYDFEIVGFPCNDFDNQEPGADSTILEFCTGEYGVTFQMMSRIVAVEADTAPIFRWLQEEELNGVANAPVTWNFNKFLIDEAGNWVAHHSSLVNPMASSITDWIMTPSAVSGILDAAPAQLELLQLLSSTEPTIRLRAVGAATVNISLLSADGKVVDVLYAGRLAEGQTVNYSTNQLSAGIYLIRTSSDEGVQTLRYVVANR